MIKMNEYEIHARVLDILIYLEKGNNAEIS